MESTVPHPAWARESVIYELNTRQFTPEGTFRAVVPRLDELQQLGVGIVWFMPIHPIGNANRKGPLGSPYAAFDYYAVNPEFGTVDDFKQLVRGIHDRGMRVVIDLVANHTAWDSVLSREHPEWFYHDGKGRFVPPVASWSDVIRLDYRHAGLRRYMLDMMEYWVRDVGIDGFRCDVAQLVPTDFWDEARRRLDRIKPVYLLAEAESPALVQDAFDCDYATELFHAFIRIARGKAGARALDALVKDDARRYPWGSWRMLFITNHDQNTWLESDVRLYGLEASKALATLTFTMPGQPLIYNGQETGNPRKLAFFARDPITWTDPHGLRAFYQRLSGIRRNWPALVAGRMNRVCTGRHRHVYAFTRTTEGSAPVLVVANLSPRPATCVVRVPRDIGKVTDALSGATLLAQHGRLQLALDGWGVRVIPCQASS